MTARRATAGTSLEDLLRLAIPLCQLAQRQCPRTGPGRPDTYDAWKIAACVTCGVLKRLKSINAQHQMLLAQEPLLRQLLELKRLPARSTYFNRYSSVRPLVAAAIRLQGRRALQEHIACAHEVAVDKSLIATRGPQWNHQDKAADRVPPKLRGLDRAADWGISGCRTWTYGYSYEVLVSATAGSVVFPLDASAGLASANEHRTALPKLRQLPPSVRNTLLDSGYDGDEQQQAVEQRPGGGRSGRRFLCPLQKPLGRQTPHNHRERPIRQRRQRRAALMKRRWVLRLYRRRRQTVEPFHGNFKAMFELDERTWHRGLGNNQSQLLTALFCYQLLIRRHWKCGGRDAQIQYLLNGL